MPEYITLTQEPVTLPLIAKTHSINIAMRNSTKWVACKQMPQCQQGFERQVLSAVWKYRRTGESVFVAREDV